MSAAEARIAVRVQPGAKKEAILGFADGVLRLRVTAPPVEGRANDAVLELVARAVGVGPSHVTLLRGARSRDKLLRIDGVSQQRAEDVLSQGAA